MHMNASDEQVVQRIDERLEHTFLTDLLSAVSAMCEEHSLWLAPDLQIEIVGMRSGRFRATVRGTLAVVTLEVSNDFNA